MKLSVFIPGGKYPNAFREQLVPAADAALKTSTSKLRCAEGTGVWGEGMQAETRGGNDTVGLTVDEDVGFAAQENVLNILS